MGDNETQIILFDGVCNLCNNIVQFTIKRDREAKFRFASLQSESGQALLKKYGLHPNNLDSFVFIKGENYYRKSTACLNVLKELGGFWKLFYFLIIIPRPLRDFMYTIIANNRYSLFGKRATCMVPTPELKKRFL